MAKGKLEFNLDDFDEQREFKRATTAADAYCALWEIQHTILREAYKYETIDGKPIEEFGSNYEAVDALVDKISKYINDNVDLDLLD